MATDWACAYCGRPAPSFDDPAVLEWEGGAAVYGVAATELPEVALVCPECRSAGEDEREEGAGD